MLKLGTAKEIIEADDVLGLINNFSEIKMKDKSGTFIGARMGRPEKAKVRKLDGDPHTLFPVGKEGGKMRSFQTAMEKGFVEAEFPTFFLQGVQQRYYFQRMRHLQRKNHKDEPLQDMRDNREKNARTEEIYTTKSRNQTLTSISKIL